MSTPNTQISTRPTTAAGMLEAKRADFLAMIPSTIDPDRVYRLAVAASKSPALAKCTPQSVVSCLVDSVKLGLVPGLLGEAYLIPFKDKATLIIGYRGLVSLARRSGEIKRLESRLVCKTDRFSLTYGDAAEFIHSFDPFADRGDVIGVYAECEFMNGATHREFMSLREIEAIRRRGHANPVWQTDWNEMARKTVLRRICKMLPLTIEARETIAADDERSGIVTTPAERPPVTVDLTAGDSDVTTYTVHEDAPETDSAPAAESTPAPATSTGPQPALLTGDALVAALLATGLIVSDLEAHLQADRANWGAVDEARLRKLLETRTAAK